MKKAQVHQDNIPHYLEIMQDNINVMVCCLSLLKTIFP